MSTTAVIVTKVDQQTKQAAQETAAELGMPLSVVIKAFIKQFIRTKRVAFSLDEEPNKNTLNDLMESEADAKAGRVISFETGRGMLDYLDAEIKHDGQPPV